GSERAALEAQIEALGLSGRVTMPGYCLDVGAELDRARLFVSSSRRESFSLVCVEALAHGLPIVVTDSGGPREIIGASGVGLIVPVGSVDALTKAIDERLDHPGDPAPRQARAREFSIETTLAAYDRLIENITRRACSPL
ncbi:MAG: glycosyltransferase, partial [Methylocystis sp.]|nr:glycosyltransferase [Methylocystis sp.]